MSDVETKLREIIGDGNVFSGADIDERYRIDVLGKYKSDPAFVVRPLTTAQVAGVVALAATHRIPITPLGGRSGVVGGGKVEDGGILVSLERMNRIVEIDLDSMTMTVEAGAILQSVHEAAEAAGALMPLDLGARGSASIGGTIATNAGGNRVLRWGMMRDMVLGLEAVLPDGTIVSSMGKMIKNNTGYDWKQLLIGSEGTLGIVTRAVLRLRPLPTSSQTALVALGSFDQVPKLLRHLEAELAGQLSSFELMWNDFYSFISGAQLGSRPRPMATGHPLYCIVEAMGRHSERDSEIFQSALIVATEQGLAEDVVIAQSERERSNLWALRDELTEAFRPLWPLIAYDVSMSLAVMHDFVEDARKTITDDYPEAIVLNYGHAGDGNVHIVASGGSGHPLDEGKIDAAVYAAVRRVGGSVSAEHGIGRSKRAYLSYTRSPEELCLMQSIKRAIDPDNIMNPNILFVQE